MKPHYIWTPSGPVFVPQDRSKAIEQLRTAGLSIPQWAKANKFNTPTVKAVLYGHSKGLRGDAHKVAVALGIKTGPVVNPEGFQPVRRVHVPLKSVSKSGGGK
jgi:gp16 family phage-associated protein